MAKPDLPSEQGYKLSIVGRHFQVTDPIREYVLEKLNKVERLTDKITDVHVTLEVEGISQSCSILMHVYHNQIKVSATTGDIYASIDKSMDKLAKLVIRHKSRLQSHRNAEDLATFAMDVVLARSSDFKDLTTEFDNETLRREQERYSIHEVVGKETIKLRTLTQDEAVMNMEINENPVFVYRSEEDQKIKVIYRRPDGDYNILQTS